MEALGINLPGLITQLISFTVLFVLLYRLLYKPILRTLDQRSTRIKDDLEAAQRIREEAAKSQEGMERQLETARREGQQLVSQAREMAERFREEELEKAREEIRLERARAQSNIQRESEAAIEEIRSEFATLAITAAERVIERSLDQPTHKQLIEKVLEEGSRIGKR